MHHAVLVSCVVDGSLVHAGIAALLAGVGSNVSPNAPRITAAVAGYLIRTGDAQGVAA